MRTKTFEGLEMQLTEKEYAQLKKRFNPQNLIRNDEGTLVNETACLCLPLLHQYPGLRSCEKCPFAFMEKRNGQQVRVGKCGDLFDDWCRHIGVSPYVITLGMYAVYLTDPSVGRRLVRAIYLDLLTWKKIPYSKRSMSEVSHAN